MTEFEIKLERARTGVRIGAGALPSVGELLAQAGWADRVLVVSDGHVAPLYGERVTRSLVDAGLKAELHVLPPGDESKSLEQASALYDRLAAGRYARDAAVLALGGGMVSDLAGFVAATWMRGVTFVICPTTLEADVDASIGGKTAVNHGAAKNLIGAFHQPRLVIIDPKCLGSLSQRDLVAGTGESIKHAAIADPSFLKWHGSFRDAVLARDADVLAELIERNVRIKADIVVRDERDRSGVRAALNFGHTVGHAIERWSNYELRHGECVALGMVAACRLSVRMGLLDEASEAAVVETIEAYGLPTSLEAPVAADELLRYIARDKKTARDRVRFVLLEGLGRTTLRDDVPEELVVEVLHTLGGA
ncbi:MAG TPA: 3-dehydroquinate synthase [Phycisphaerae bacterium]|nr:3-dehydroquinate synthase [Phycisphaerae bacterium]